MAEETMALLDVLRKGDEPGGDVLVEGLRWLLQELMDAEVSAQIGAGRYERTNERTTQRNGYRSRPWDTRLGTLELAIPKLRQGSYFPSCWSHVGARSRRWSLSWPRHTCRASARARLRRWSSRWASPDSARVKSVDCARCSMSRRRSSAADRWMRCTRTYVHLA